MEFSLYPGCHGIEAIKRVGVLKFQEMDNAGVDNDGIIDSEFKL